MPVTTLQWKIRGNHFGCKWMRNSVSTCSEQCCSMPRADWSSDRRMGLRCHNSKSKRCMRQTSASTISTSLLRDKSGLDPTEDRSNSECNGIDDSTLYHLPVEKKQKPQFTTYRKRWQNRFNIHLHSCRCSYLIRWMCNHEYRHRISFCFCPKNSYDTAYHCGNCAAVWPDNPSMFSCMIHHGWNSLHSPRNLEWNS